MRLTAYKELITECKNLPESISVKRKAIDEILNQARMDKSLYGGEYVELHCYARK